MIVEVSPPYIHAVRAVKVEVELSAVTSSSPTVHLVVIRSHVSGNPI